MGVGSRLLLTSVAISMAGCGPSTTTFNILTGDFTAYVAGDLSASIQGTAGHGGARVDARGGGIRWAFTFWSGDSLDRSPDKIVLSRVGTLVAPLKGTYTIYDAYDDSLHTGDFVATYSALRSQDQRTRFASSLGTLTVDWIIESRIKGSFSFDARVTDANSPSLGQHITTEGTFTSLPTITVASQ